MGDKLKRLLLLTLSFVSIIGCEQAGVSDLRSSNGRSANALAPSYWPNAASAFPLNVRLSTSFTGAENDSIQASAASWSTAVSNKETFFSTAAFTGEKGSSLNSYNDGLLGVYKLSAWPSDLEGSALAVTQLFGLRKNIGKSNEAIEISHADILVNYDNFEFSTDGSAGYDLETVIVHEFGHFLGLGHDQSSPANSVMYPTISRFTQNRTPKADDTSNIENLYNITGGGATASRAAFRSIASVEDEGPSEQVVIQFELLADGSERVKMNNKYIKNYKCKHKH
jgi:hypothetical protein